MSQQRDLLESKGLANYWETGFGQKQTSIAETAGVKKRVISKACNRL